MYLLKEGPPGARCLRFGFVLGAGPARQVAEGREERRHQREAEDAAVCTGSGCPAALWGAPIRWVCASSVYPSALTSAPFGAHSDPI